MLCGFCGGDCLGIFFRLGKIYGYVKRAVFSFRFPFQILANSIAANVVRVLRKFVKPIRGGFRVRFGAKRFENVDDVGRRGNEKSHDFCVEQIAANDSFVRKDFILARKIQKLRKNVFQIANFDGGKFFRLLWRFKSIKREKFEQTVLRVDNILLSDKTSLERVAHESIYIFVNVHNLIITRFA